ncbi:hypothetical protein BD770DRAFT_432637 [Pilaira anomala]|nr:hypothetical protein BD770DRAFT_432637 [Pilaira anomala]
MEDLKHQTDFLYAERNRNNHENPLDLDADEGFDLENEMDNESNDELGNNMDEMNSETNGNSDSSDKTLRQFSSTNKTSLRSKVYKDPQNKPHSKKAEYSSAFNYSRNQKQSESSPDLLYVESLKNLTLNDFDTESSKKKKGKQKMDYRKIVPDTDYDHCDYDNVDSSLARDMPSSSKQFTGRRRDSINSDTNSPATSISNAETEFSQGSQNSASKKRMSNSFETDVNNNQGKRSKANDGSKSKDPTIPRELVELKGRGRPKKVPLDNQDETPKRGRGRPPKNNQNEKSEFIYNFFVPTSKK